MTTLAKRKIRVDFGRGRFVRNILRLFIVCSFLFFFKSVDAVPIEHLGFRLELEATVVDFHAQVGHFQWVLSWINSSGDFVEEKIGNIIPQLRFIRFSAWSEASDLVMDKFSLDNFWPNEQKTLLEEAVRGLCDAKNSNFCPRIKRDISALKRSLCFCGVSLVLVSIVVAYLCFWFYRGRHNICFKMNDYEIKKKELEPCVGRDPAEQVLFQVALFALALFPSGFACRELWRAHRKSEKLKEAIEWLKSKLEDEINSQIESVTV